MASYGAVGGGNQNTAGGLYATVGGGSVNTANYTAATVSGGTYNTASDYAATVGGGEGNTAINFAATVSGGNFNHLIILRLVHIVAGAFWAGSALMLALVILPGVRKAGPGSERHLPMAKISQAMGISALLTTVAGLLLYWLISGFSWAWISSPLGIGLTLGSLAGIAAFLLGAFSTGPTSGKIAALGAQMQAAGGPPQPEQLAEMGRLQAKLASSSQWGTILATAALALMAVARYL